jgi:hypothetical protein
MSLSYPVTVAAGLRIFGGRAAAGPGRAAMVSKPAIPHTQFYEVEEQTAKDKKWGNR